MTTLGINSRFGKGLLAEVLLNGMPVVSVRPGHDSFQSLPIQHEILPGTNRLEIVMNPPLSPDGGPSAGDPATMYVEMAVEAEEMEDLGDSYEFTTRTIRTTQWRATAGAPMPPQHRILLEWSVDESIAPPAWTRARALGPDEARRGISTALREIRMLLIDRRIDEFQALMRVRNEDMARAYPAVGSARRRAELDTVMLDQLLPPSPVPFAPIDEARLQLRPFAGGRVVGCAMDDGLSPLRLQVTGSKPFEIDIAFAMINGRISVIR